MSKLDDTIARVLQHVRERGHGVTITAARLVHLDGEPVPEVQFGFSGHMPADYLGQVKLLQPRSGSPAGNGSWVFKPQGAATAISMSTDEDVQRAATAICDHLAAR